MKHKKIIAVVLSSAMLMSALTGCSKVKKVNLKATDKAADKLEAEVYDDFEEFAEADRDELEDGIYLSMNRDAVEEFYDDHDDEYDDAEDEIEDAIDEVNDFLGTDIEFELDDVQEGSIYMRSDDENVMAIAYINVGDSNIASEVFQGIVDNQDFVNDELADLFDELDYDSDFEFNLDEFSKDEYYFNGKDIGYIRLCLTEDDVEDIAENYLMDLLDEVDFGYLSSSDAEDLIDEIVDEMPFDLISVGIYVNGSSIVFSVIATDDDDMIEDYETYMNAIGLKPSTEVECSDYTKTIIANSVVVGIGSVLTSFSSLRYDF